MMTLFTIIIIKPASNPTPIANNTFIPAISVRHNAKIEPTDKSIPLSENYVKSHNFIYI